jgi:hypothetical protein
MHFVAIKSRRTAKPAVNAPNPQVAGQTAEMLVAAIRAHMGLRTRMRMFRLQFYSAEYALAPFLGGLFENHPKKRNDDINSSSCTHIKTET